MMKTIGAVSWQLLLWLILIPGLLGTLLVLMSRKNKQLVTGINGLPGMILFGGIGVMLHELSHLIVALLFGHHIDRVALLHIPRRDDLSDNRLGYVNHSWNDHNLYQRCGNFFIGIAPVIGCTLIMTLLTRYLAPQIYNDCLQLLLPTASPLPVGEGQKWQFWAWLILMVNIAVGGFDLSSADLRNSLHGITALIIVLIVVVLLLTWLSTPLTVGQWLKEHLLICYWALILAIVFNVILWIILRLLYRH